MKAGVGRGGIRECDPRRAVLGQAVVVERRRRVAAAVAVRRPARRTSHHVEHGEIVTHLIAGSEAEEVLELVDEEPGLVVHEEKVPKCGNPG